MKDDRTETFMDLSGWKITVRFSDGGRLASFAKTPDQLAKRVLEEALHGRTAEIVLTRVLPDGSESPSE